MIFRTVSYRDGVPGAGGRVNKSEWVCPYDEKNPDNGPALRFYGRNCWRSTMRFETTTFVNC
jgi:hypothetical protein